MTRSIIHLNVADFAVAVERIVDRRLQNRPMIVAPLGSARAVVYDMSEEAYQCGIRKHMPLRMARRLCPDASVLHPHPDRYERAMRALLKQALPYSPLDEAGDGDGHLFGDTTGTGRLFGPPGDSAWRLHRQGKTDLGLDPIWSVAPNKLVAKAATRRVKPVGEYVVGAGEEAVFLAPLPIRLVPGLERDDLDRLKAFNFTRVSQVMALSLEHLQVPFGNRARFLYEAVRGSDSSPVLPAGRGRRSSATMISTTTRTSRQPWKAPFMAWRNMPAAGCADSGVRRGASALPWIIRPGSGLSARPQQRRPRPTI